MRARYATRRNPNCAAVLQLPHPQTEHIFVFALRVATQLLVGTKKISASRVLLRSNSRQQQRSGMISVPLAVLA